MRVEVNESERPMHGGDGPKLGERHRVVATDPEGDNTGFDDGRDECLDRRERVFDVTRDCGSVSEVDRREGSEDLHLLDRVVRSEHRGR